MKNRPILKIAILITLVVHLVFIFALDSLGADSVLPQMGKLFLQLILIYFVLERKSKFALWLLAGYHVFVGIFLVGSTVSAEFIGQVFIVFHLMMAVVIYFHDYIEEKFNLPSR